MPRWWTPDPGAPSGAAPLGWGPAGLAAVDPNNPQTWNRYAYVGNTPLEATDPLGLEAADGDGTATTTYTCQDQTLPIVSEGEQTGEIDEGTISIPHSSIGGGDPFALGPPGPAGPAPLSPNSFAKEFELTTPCGSSASQAMNAVEGNFAQFGNYSRWRGAESVTFSPPAGMGPGSTIPIDVGILCFHQSLSVTIQSLDSQSMTFTTNLGHLIYPGWITFAASPASPGSINFSINLLGGTVANSFEFDFGGSAFEDAQWNHFLGQVNTFCGAGG